MQQFIKRFVDDRSGATVIEYGLIACLICLAIVTATTTLGTSLRSGFNNVATNVAK